MKVQVTDYSPTWREMFEREKQLLAAVIKESASIEHIGSTSVVGLAAKPVMDILIGLDDFSTADEIVPRVEALGYKYVPEYEDVMPDRRYFKKVAGGISTHHIHMVKIGGEFWQRHLLFRDFLRTNPDIADEYAALKKNLSAVEWKDKNDYTEAKTAFIKNIENKAKKLENESGAT
jgi:GrpB-like predicted nucleotidyltransferase (UPF0157 family)